MCLNFKGKMLRAALGHSGKRQLEAALCAGHARNAHANLDCSPPPGSGRTCATETEKASLYFISSLQSMYYALVLTA